MYLHTHVHTHEYMYIYIYMYTHVLIAIPDIIGLIIIMAGLVCYRFANDLYIKWKSNKGGNNVRGALDLKHEDTLVTRLNRDSNVSQEY